MVGTWLALARGEAGREQCYPRGPPTTGRPRLTPTSNAGVVGHTHATDSVVGHCGHLARTPCAMPVGAKSTALKVDSARQEQPKEQKGQADTPPTTAAPRSPLGLWPLLRPDPPPEPPEGQHCAWAERSGTQAPPLLLRAPPFLRRPRAAISDLLSFICVYRGCGSGSWSLTSKLAPGSWKERGCCQDLP